MQNGALLQPKEASSVEPVPDPTELDRFLPSRHP
jgi:hypothetical protein